jgi:hypothetical protein
MNFFLVDELVEVLDFSIHRFFVLSIVSELDLSDPLSEV